MPKLLLEVGQNGELTLPPEALEVLAGRKLVLTVEGSSLQLEPENGDEAIVERLRKWKSFKERIADPDAPALSDWAVSRDSMYD